MTNKENKKSKHIISIFALLMVALIWGIGFPALKIAGDIPTFVINSIRFSAASILLILIFPKKLKLIDKSTAKLGIIMGIAMFAAYWCATEGIKYTTSSRSAFFSAISGVFVPFVSRIILRNKIKIKTWICVILCLMGAYLISFTGTFSEFGMNKGDIICVFSAVACATEIVIVGNYAKDKDTISLTIAEMITVSVICIICALISGDKLPEKVETSQWLALAFLSIFPTAVAFVLKCFGQKNVSGSTAGLILTMEPVFGGIFSMLILKENMGIYGYIGGLIIVISIVISENDFSIKNKTEGSGLNANF